MEVEGYPGGGAQRATASAQLQSRTERSGTRAFGLQLVNFRPNSGDLNPIQTVWARLRRDLALREMQDLQDLVVLTDAQYRQRAAQVLPSYSQPASRPRMGDRASWRS